MISIVIPAHNEAAFIESCLGSIAASEIPHACDALAVQVIVVANGCHDDTADTARAGQGGFESRGWRLDVLELTEGSKTAALNAGDDTAIYDMRAYIDADVCLAPDLLAGLVGALDRPEPVYASGCPQIRKARSFVSRRYARFWERLPFVATGVPGFGVYAVNAAARAKWGRFPDIISDDSFVRLQFRGREMCKVPHGYSWPIAEGFANLVRVRRRQDLGLHELGNLHPELLQGAEATRPNGRQLCGLALRDPLGFAVYGTVALAVRSPFFKARGVWDRSR